MKFIQALTSYNLGKKIKRSSWADNCLICKEYWQYQDTVLTALDIVAEDWQVLEEADFDMLHQRCKSCQIVEKIMELLKDKK